MEYTQVSATAFQELQLNAGIVVSDFDPSDGSIDGDILGVTSGGITFASNPTYVDFGDGMDNVPDNTWQLKRVQGYDPTLSGTFLTITDELAKQLSGAGGLSSNHITPSHALTETDFDDIWLVGDYSDKNDNGTNKLDAAMKQKLGLYYDYLQGLENLQKNTGIQARMPFDMIIE